jgi:hypothetical protein
VKVSIYATKTLDLWAWIMEAVGPIILGILQLIWAELDYRVDILRVTNGSHVEEYSQSLPYL